MAGIATLAKARGHQVTGMDQNIYPPMSNYLEDLGIQSTCYTLENLPTEVDDFVIGNVISRGNPVLEYILSNNLPYLSGPEWLAKHILPKKWRLVVAGTHGKTTTSSMIAWILEATGRNPGFLIGGIPENFGVSARLTDSEFFVIEGDEYDTAFSDKRSKFVHYGPKTFVLNNLEYDHADIFPDLQAIERQFHHGIRLVPKNGLLIANTSYSALLRALELGIYSPLETTIGAEADWQLKLLAKDASVFEVFFRGESQGVVKTSMLGEHNAHNALSAIAAVRHLGIPAEEAIAALSTFTGVKRRLQLRGEVRGIRVYDDFAHHPTAIRTTLLGIKASSSGRVIALLEPRSNTMRMGVHQADLKASLEVADQVHIFEPPHLTWNMAEALQGMKTPWAVHPEIESMVESVIQTLKPGDQIIVMSNGGFAGIHEKLLRALGEEI